MGWVLIFGAVERRVALLKINVIGSQPLGIWCGVLESVSGPHRPESRPGRAAAWSEKGVNQSLSEAPKTSGRFSEVGHFWAGFSTVFRGVLSFPEAFRGCLPGDNQRFRVSSGSFRPGARPTLQGTMAFKDHGLVGVSVSSGIILIGWMEHQSPQASLNAKQSEATRRLRKPIGGFRYPRQEFTVSGARLRKPR